MTATELLQSQAVAVVSTQVSELCTLCGQGTGKVYMLKLSMPTGEERNNCLGERDSDQVGAAPKTPEVKGRQQVGGSTCQHTSPLGVGTRC